MSLLCWLGRSNQRNLEGGKRHLNSDDNANTPSTQVAPSRVSPSTMVSCTPVLCVTPISNDSSSSSKLQEFVYSYKTLENKYSNCRDTLTCAVACLLAVINASGLNNPPSQKVGCDWTPGDSFLDKIWPYFGINLHLSEKSVIQAPIVKAFDTEYCENHIFGTVPREILDIKARIAFVAFDSPLQNNLFKKILVANTFIFYFNNKQKITWQYSDRCEQWPERDIP